MEEYSRSNVARSWHTTQRSRREFILVKKPVQIEIVCNQTDLPATLLGQLGISHDEFTFSRDVLSSTYTKPFATHTFDDGFSFRRRGAGRVLHGHGLRHLADHRQGQARLRLRVRTPHDVHPLRRRLSRGRLVRDPHHERRHAAHQPLDATQGFWEHEVISG